MFFPHVLVKWAVLHQHIVRSLTGKLAVIYDKDVLGILDCREAMGDDDKDLILHEFFKSFLDVGLVLTAIVGL